MGRISKQGANVRVLIFFLALICFTAPPVFCADRTGLDSFIKSREVVATLYFQANSDDLTKAERERIAGTISLLRKQQKEGRMIRVEGFSSPEGDAEVNFRLSFFRARAVADIIAGKGLPAEVTLTGYGGLHAKSDDPAEERRVEIVSYIKPAGLKRVKVANRQKKIVPGLLAEISQALQPEKPVIDALAIEQAIMEKIGTEPVTPMGSVSQVDTGY